MELIRRNSDYALRSLSHIARFPLGSKFTLRTIARKEDVPFAFLRKTFQKLSRKKIVGSHLGPKGGFYLLKEPSQITLGDILEAVQGPISLSDCLRYSGSCKRIKSCRVNKKLLSIQKEIDGLLAKTTLGELI